MYEWVFLEIQSGKTVSGAPTCPAATASQRGTRDVLIPIRSSKDGARLACRDIDDFTDVDVLTRGMIVSLSLQIPVVVVREIP